MERLHLIALGGWLALTHAVSAADLTAQFTTAERAVVARDFAAANQQLEKLADIAPTDPRLGRLKVLRKLKQRDYPGALALADEALANHSFDAELHILRGIALSGLGKHSAQACVAFNTARQIEPDNSRALAYCGLSMIYAGLLDRAEELLTRAIELDKNNPRAYRHRAVLHRMQSDFGSASRDLETAETLDPHDTDTHSIRCDLIEDRWGAEVALLAMKEIMAREAEYEYYHRRLARLQAQTRQIEEARQSYDRAVELLPADGPARLERLEFELAQAPQTNPLADKLEQDLQVALADARSRPAALGVRARLHRKAERYPQMVADLAEIAWHERAGGLFTLAQFMLDAPLGDNAVDITTLRDSLPMAIAETDEQHKQVPTDQQLLGRLAILYWWSNRPEDFLTLLTQQAATAGDACQLRELRAEALLRLNRVGEALALATTADSGALLPQPTPLLAELALFARGDFLEARRLANAALERDPFNPRTAWLRQYLFELAGERDQACDERSRAEHLMARKHRSTTYGLEARLQALIQEAAVRAGAFEKMRLHLSRDRARREVLMETHER